MTTPGFSDSDTEHSSQYSQDDALPEPLTLRGNDEIQSSSDIVELTEHLALAVQELCKWDESTTEVDFDIHHGLIQVPGVIISFLEQAIQYFKLGSVDSCVWDCLRELCQVSVIEKLFVLRRTFHQLSAEENNNNENVAVVSCVDALFAKLGHLVSHIGSYQRDEACPSLPSDPLPQNSFTIGGHREETSLRAALQLPHTLAQLISIIASDHASIAVIRLAIRILFSATVLQCPPGVKFSFPFNCHDALQTFLCKRATELGATGQPDQALEDRTMISMAVSMFAMFDFAKIDELHAQFRPHTQAVMLEHIARILQGNAADEQEFNPIEPLILRDPSQRLLIDWGVTIPWCWTVWNDDRCTDYDSILSVTVTWLYHLGDDPSHYEAKSWEEGLELCMAYSPTNAIICLLNLLHRANEVLLENELSSRQLSVATLHVMLRCCWGIKEVLCVLDNKEDMLAQLSANALCRLFILLQDSKEELIVKECIIAGLACVDPSVFSVVLQDVAEDTGLKVSERLSANVGNIVR
ncbi:hypothetical protein BC629DRAFT_845726 [Irpex lacteus]|nr:hypothetical protein BC629DRAFT_845726 [Irpex lacteus]